MWLVVLAATLIAQSIQAQPWESWRTSAIHGAMNYRASVLGDTISKFDRCRVDGQITDTAFVSPASASLRRLMLGPCMGEVAAGHPMVRVDSVRGDLTGAMVYATVVRGGWQHQETFVLVPLRATLPIMSVEEVLMSAGVEFRYVRQTPPQPPLH
ncbi:hypothetical protein [Longimicrobium terrae]|uniref:Uncharacterized protein n=1 Tax=Longimicrobium terrae TaxID=1639882 RepID=A0A841GVU0_9BACT|nr:hypothetical protein [Longimicrobium terrae]MBB4635554.1 hypothetical protein [Longimicrobium terrae]MBB6069948.1 hypothetical protein [Longimicrobium terrae]NNC32861.1 hypothetical protein [Longimicrobium terrae]